MKCFSCPEPNEVTRILFLLLLLLQGPGH
ncbi:unnamed protein product, partial [Didymodactylos carnosus]